MFRTRCPKSLLPNKIRGKTQFQALEKIFCIHPASHPFSRRAPPSNPSRVFFYFTCRVPRQTTWNDFGASLGRKALISWPDLSSLSLRRHEIKRLILPSKSCASVIINSFMRRTDGRIGVCVAPVAAGDKSGAQRKAYRTSGAYKSRYKSSAP